MARLNTDGLSDIAAQIQKMGEKSSEKVDKMLQSGGEILTNELKNTAIETFRSDRSSGELARSIKAKKINSKHGKLIVIMPTGKDKKGVKNAVKGYVLEYGRSNMKAYSWVSKSVLKCENKVNEEMRKIWEQE